jgi:deoxynucleotide monophosphate kinase-like protein
MRAAYSLTDPAAATSPILGISGVMGAGKDALATLICAAHTRYTVRKFATALREALSIITGVPAEKTISHEDKAVELCIDFGTIDALVERIMLAIAHVTGAPCADSAVATQMAAILTGASETVRIEMTVARSLQLIGTECFRDLVDKDVWVRALFDRWEKEGRPPMVISDVRFPNEAAAIRAAGGVALLVRRDTTATPGFAGGRVTEHSSERALNDDEPDHVFYNSGTLDDLDHAFKTVWPFILGVARARGMC